MMETEKTFYQRLIEVQSALQVPKTKRKDSSVRFAYRTAEEILTVAKPLCAERGLLLNLTDTVKLIGERYYLEATASVTDGEETVSAVGCSHEPEKLQIMSECQTTGAASSYARKVALGGLFALDDGTNDPDAQQQDNKKKQPRQESKPMVADRKLLIEKLTEQGKLETTLNWGGQQGYGSIDEFPDDTVIALLKKCSEVQ